MKSQPLDGHIASGAAAQGLQQYFCIMYMLCAAATYADAGRTVCICTSAAPPCSLALPCACTVGILPLFWRLEQACGCTGRGNVHHIQVRLEKGMQCALAGVDAHA